MKLTIGTFDGVHLGHQEILKRVDQVVTFSNHPHAILRKHSPQALTTLDHKLQLLKSLGIPAPHVIPFTLEFSQKSAEHFLCELQKMLPFDHLILGHDAVIGSKREGTAEHLVTLAHKMHFTLEYIEPITRSEEIISSSHIRKFIEQGKLKKAEALLGRPFSIVSHVTPGAGKGEAIGAATANINVDALCMPPKGVYAIKAKLRGQNYPGIANLGFAPTLQQRCKPQLEVHLFDLHETLYGEQMEVIFLDYIRGEKQFKTVEELQKQIASDIQECKKRITSPSLTM